MNRNESSFDVLLTDHLKRNSAQIPHPRYGLDVVHRRIAADLAAKDAEKHNTTRSTARSWFADLFLVQSPRHALALGVITVQFAAIAGLALHALSGRPEYETTRSSSGMIAPAQTEFIRLSFKPTATEGEIRKLLNSVQGEIVAGPTQIGEYYVLTAQDQIAQHTATLKGSALVEAADVVKRLP